MMGFRVSHFKTLFILAACAAMSPLVHAENVFSTEIIQGAVTPMPSGHFSKPSECKPSPHKSLTEQAKAITVATEQMGPKGLALGRSFSPACSNFINKKGLGPWGVQMISAARTVAPQCFYNRNLFGSLCPKYLSLTTDQKDAMIALAFAAIGESESRCDPNAQAQGVNDLAVGIFQLENSAAVRNRAGRHDKWCRTQTKTNTKSWEFQSECAVSIVEDTVCSWGSVIFDPGGYWEQLRRNRAITKRIRDTAKKWGFCE